VSFYIWWLFMVFNTWKCFLCLFN